MAMRVRMSSEELAALKAGAERVTAGDAPPGADAPPDVRAAIDEADTQGAPAGAGLAPPGGGTSSVAPQEDAIARKVEERRTQAEARLRKLQSGTIVGALAASAVFLVVAIGRSGWQFELSGSPGTYGVSAAFLFLAAALFTLSLLDRSGNGFLSFLIGKDGRVSTSYTQGFLWTALLACTFIHLLVHSVGMEGAIGSDLSESLATLDASYLLLLGGPFAAVVATGLLVQAKLDSGALQKTKTDAAELRTVLTDDDGRADLIDSQFFVFNLVAMVWFVGSLWARPGELPVIPQALIGLTSLSALTYTAAKAAASNAPAIRSITRRGGGGEPGIGIRPGDEVEIHGINLLPTGARTADQIGLLRVKFDTLTVAPIIEEVTDPNRGSVTLAHPTPELVVARVPSAGLDLTKPVPVVVVTPAGVESPPASVAVDEDVPVITAVEPSVAKADTMLRVRGRYFRRSGQPAEPGNLPSFAFGDVVVPADSWLEEGAVRVKVPKAVEPTTGTAATVMVSAKQSDGFTSSKAVPLTVQPSS